MNGSIDTTSSQNVLATPRTSLQNIGEKKDEDEKVRGGNTFQAFGADGFTFLDFLDIINPLQHIPVIGTAYRALTGDEIDPGSRIAGGTLFGGPIGTIVSMANVAVEQNTGKDMGDHMMAWFTDEDGEFPLDEEGVKLANTPDPANFVTAAGTAAEEIADAASPISTNAEVLEWARRETARVSDAENEARLKAPKPIAPVGAIDVAGNIEVLNWARQEAALSRSPVENADANALDKKREEKHARIEDAQASLNKTIAMGRDQSQLSGATAPLGGWFSETMLVALAKYDEGAQLGKSSQERHVEATLDITE
jgi:hypothetical protein